LDPRDTRAAIAVGTGIVKHYKPIANYSLDNLITAGAAAADSDADNFLAIESVARTWDAHGWPVNFLHWGAEG
jgi:hypothetical protein